MTTSSRLFVWGFFCWSSTLATRHLEENGNYNGDNANGDDRFAFVNDATERLEQDAEGMWNTSPSQWIMEYWEVFGVSLLVLVCLLACNCVVCCCLGNGTAEQKPMTVTTARELNEKQRHDLEQPILLETPQSPSSFTDRQNSTVVAGGESVSTKGKRRPRSTVLGEVVSVWSEFLGFSEQEEADPRFYKNMNTTTGSTKSKKKKVKRKSSPSKVAELPTQDV